MKIIQKLNYLPKPSWKQPGPPTTIVLHHTAGPTLSGAEQTLKARKLGYHSMIDLGGAVYQYYQWTDAANHAYGANKLTVGVSLVGGGGTPLTKDQIKATKELCKLIKEQVPSVKYVTSHKEIDPRHQKTDPDFRPFDETMDEIAEYSGLKRKLK